MIHRVLERRGAQAGGIRYCLLPWRKKGASWWLLGGGDTDLNFKAGAGRDLESLISGIEGEKQDCGEELALLP